MGKQSVLSRKRVTSAVGVVVAVGGAALAFAVVPALAAAPTQPSVVEPVTQWSEVIDDGGEGVRAQARFRVISVDGTCFVQTLSEAGAGGVTIAPTACP